MPRAKPLATIDLCLTSEDSETADSDLLTMQTDQDDISHKKTSEKSDSESGRSSRKGDRKSESKDKPRIVLTFRSEKPGAKSSNMKIVSTEEKLEEVSPRRSTRLGTKGESDYECEVSVKSDKVKSKPTSETEDQYETSPSKRPQRSTKTRHQDSTPQTDVSTSSQRPSRHIKPTAKALANQKMQLKEGVRTRSGRTAKNVPTEGSEKKKEPDVDVEESNTEKLEHLEGLGLKAREGSNKAKDSESEDRDVEVEDDVEDVLESEEEVDDDLEVIKKLLEEDTDYDEEYVPTTGTWDKTTSIIRTRRGAALTETKQTNDDSQPDVPLRNSRTTKRKRPRTPTPPPEEEMEPEDETVDSLEAETAEASEEAAEPDDSAVVTAACTCLKLTNIHAEPSDLPESVFCQAIESVDGVRVGCSHGAARGSGGALLPLVRCSLRTPYFLACALHEKQLRRHMCCPSCGLFCTQVGVDCSTAWIVYCLVIESVDGVRVSCSHGAARGSGGALLPLVRCSLRTPYFLACALHEKQLRRHMCCPSCGLFCTQGSFYQCSLGHLFHVECAAGAARGGCPHCGVRGGAPPPRPPVNCQLSRVTVTMTCSNKKRYMPDQREHCTPAFLSFAPLQTVLPEGPIIPADLLPPPTVDIAKMCKEADESGVGDETDVVRRIVDGIEAGETVELVPKIVAARSFDINKPVDAAGNTLVHIAATNGRLFALHLLRGARASLDVTDGELRTPLMAAIQALLDKTSKDKEEEDQKSPKPTEKNLKHKEEENKETEIKMEVDDTDLPADSLAEVKAEVDLVQDNHEDNVESTKTEEEETAAEQEEEEVKDDVIKEQKTEKNKEEVEEVSEEEKAEIEKKQKMKEEELLKVIRYLVAAGADLNITGAEGMTALHMAAQLGGASVVNCLLSSARAGVDLADLGGWTPLVHAAENKHRDVVSLLLSHGADPSRPDLEGNAAVHWCALAGDAACLQLMLDHAPAAVDLTNAAADTPLHVAGRQNHYDCVVVLLARGARTDCENCGGELAVDACAGACRAAVSLHMQAAIAAGATCVARVLHSDLANGREPYPLPCVNSVDDAPAPADFTYVAELLTPAPLQQDNTIQTLQGCSCRDSCADSCGCTAVSVRRWYRGGRLRDDFPYHDAPLLFECNATCACNPKRCTNSPVSRLLKTGSLWVRAQVYRAGGARGWGLRCVTRVPRGAPVAAYTGELLYAALADQRAPDHYMFAIDVKPGLLEQLADARQFCVDAAVFGGAARFMNHSCAPSLTPLRVLTSSRDLRAATITLFAVEDLPPYTPLTFDYGDKFWSVKSKYMSCECGEPNCRYPTKSTEDMES